MARPEPPEKLSQEEAAEWRAIVNRLPPNWFKREVEAVLVQYCRHVVAAERLQKLIQAMEKEEELDVVAYEKIAKLRLAESKGIAQLARTLQLDATRNM
jgi:uncharacterized protein (DUF1697 family)